MAKEPSIDLTNVLEKNSRLVKGLEKMILNMHTVSNIRYWYWCLSSFPESPNLLEDIMRMEALATSIIVSYGRIFGKGNGTMKLENEIVPKHLCDVHDSIINLRHGRYAHHGNHETVEVSLGIRETGASIIINPNMNLQVYLGAPKEWAPLFQWLDEHMYALLHEKLRILTEKTEIEWKIQDGPTPHWIESESMQNTAVDLNRYKTPNLGFYNINETSKL